MKKYLSKPTIVGVILILGILIFISAGCEKNNGNAVTADIGAKGQETSSLTVLVYHDITTDDIVSDGSCIRLDDFIKQMDYLAEHDYQTLGLEEFMACYQQDGFPEKSVMITFDDGYQSFLHLAYPVLKEHDFHAVIFPIVSLTPGLEQDMIFNQHLTFHDLRLMDKESGLVDIGSHTYDLHYYSDSSEPAVKRQKGEGRSDYKDRIEKDLRVSKDILELQTGKSIDALAWPYGIANRTAVQIAKDLDYRLLFTLLKGPITPDTPLDRLPRNAVSSGSLKDFIDILNNC